MPRLALPLIAACSLAAMGAAAAPASAAEVQIEASGPVVELTVTEQVRAAPDIADISAGVSSRARTAVEAMRLNAQEMTRVIERMRSLGIASQDIQTTGINLNARYDYDRATQRQVFRGYEASNRVSVVVRDVERVGPILDALVAAGTTDLGGPSFRMDDDSAAKAQAREAAVASALERARQYARWSGYGDVRLLSVSESVVNAPRPMAQMRTMDVVEQAATPVQPGLVGTSVTLSLQYEMVR